MTSARPTLTTERLVLEPLGPEHLDDLVALDSDPEVLRYIIGRALTRAEVEASMPERLEPEADARGLGQWAGRHEGRFIGWWSLAVDPDDIGAAQLGYRLRRDVWGQGFATEGARALLDHAFGTVGLSRVWAETMSVNHASRSVLTKLGMRLIHIYVGTWDDPLPGWERGELVYEISRGEWG